MIIDTTLEGLNNYSFQKHEVGRGRLLSFTCWQNDTCKLRLNNSKQEHLPSLLLSIPNNCY